MRRSWTDRLRTLAVPALVVGLGATGVTVAAWPGSNTIVAQPAAAGASVATPAARDEAAERTSRLRADARPALTGSAAADAATPKTESVQEKSGQAAGQDETGAKKSSGNDKSGAQKKSKKRSTKKSAVKKFRPTAAQLEVSSHRYTRVALNVRRQPAQSSGLVTVLKAGSRLSVTKTTQGSWTLVIHRGEGRWVHTRYLTAKKPESGSDTSKSSGGGISMASCSSGSGMESGLTRDAIRVHRAICHRFPSVTSFGGMRSGGDSYHTSGRAVDAMISSSSTGWEIAKWVRANRKKLGVSEVIFSQHIWTVQRGGEGWRSMSDRGNATANHYDHVHVSVYGNAGTS